ncbi:hypothetical protein [Deinococcus sonorensis]|uniref:DUF1049 domain-containing protein n=2 Tax=Deinococcus sonorensis TaxID=309891 RepID=A0AAU7UDR4_9DEIO
MNSVLARGLTIFGLIVLVVAAVLLGKNVYDINILHAVAIANRSSSYFNPVFEVMIATGLALVAGLLLGLGLSRLRRRQA